jgi:nicotinamidase-related amidase
MFLCLSQAYLIMKAVYTTLLALGLGLPDAISAQLYDTYNSFTATAGTANYTDPHVIGNYYNYWRTLNNHTTWDLTRRDRLPVTSPKTIPMLGHRKEAIIEPSRTAMVIVDMQNFFLHPQLSPSAVRGRLAVRPTLNLIDAFRANGMKVLWVQWGIDAFDLLTISPSDLDGFSDNHRMDTSFCTDMGTLKLENGTTIQLGKKLCRGSWNAQPYGPLNDALIQGQAAGTDFYFNKSMFFFLFEYLT